MSAKVGSKCNWKQNCSRMSQVVSFALDRDTAIPVVVVALIMPSS
jgi:hypothetical protein